MNSLSLSIIINSLCIPGIASSSFGKQTIASGDYANAFGERSEARGRSSMVYADNFKLSKGTFGDIGKMADRINELVRVAQNLNDRVTEIELKYIGK